ncbi:hypothetical protein SCOR_20825 [Sulfidibacter corallicola]|uniref:Uncharacterized protein n=1 Tax=Sulfidibacter corallicola TaxID=2818388 RepID=A0A8A4TT31_SULCO|nr:hypothetical protein [Sulfidibacter corallicola]QTD53116.1 hypothetical protein J3U87_11700 [Sulfidibacter corallicola]
MAADLMNPLDMRLALHRFAWVQLDVRVPLFPWDWGLDAFEVVMPSRSAPSWLSVLKRCRDVRPGSHRPVIGIDLKDLNRIRIREPSRPLVFLQTPFERAPPIRALRRLAGPSPFPGLCWEGDGLQPLYWLPARPTKIGDCLEAYRGMSVHPAARMKARLQATASNVTCWYGEAGELWVQPSLLSPWNLLRVDDLRENRQTLARRFRDELGDFEGAAWVLAASNDRLAWFRRDCLRVLGPRFRCVAFPDLPDPRDRQPHFVMATDARIRFADLRRFPILHADGDAARRRYRHARAVALGPGKWIALSEPRRWGRVRWNRCILTLWSTPRGWSCAPAVREENEAGWVDLGERIRALSELFGWRERLEPISRCEVGEMAGSVGGGV